MKSKCMTISCDYKTCPFAYAVFCIKRARNELLLLFPLIVFSITHNAIFFLLLLQCSVRAQIFLVLKGKARESARLHGNAVNASGDFGIVKNCIQCVFKSIKPSNNSCCNKDIMWNVLKGVMILNPSTWETSSCISSSCYVS